MKKNIKITKSIKNKFVNIIFRNKIITEIKWRVKNKPIPAPHFIKQRIIKSYARKFSIKIFIETGTYLGDTIMSLRNNFDKIYSIELDKILFENAKNKFSKYHHIHIFQGDSSDILPDILLKINQPALFWLDGHYSGGITSKGNLNTPVIKEIELILSHKIKNHVILIDDARLFIGKEDYPTLIEFEAFIKKIDLKLDFQVHNDIIRIIKL